MRLISALVEVDYNKVNTVKLSAVLIKPDVYRQSLIDRVAIVYGRPGSKVPFQKPVSFFLFIYFYVLASTSRTGRPCPDRKEAVF